MKLATALTRPNETLTVIAITEKSRKHNVVHRKQPLHANFLATHYEGSKIISQEPIYANGLKEAVTVARGLMGWQEEE